jgi:hypothetical protein
MPNQVVIPEDQLPDWIRSANRSLDWGGLVVLVASVLISTLYWSGTLITPDNNSIHLAFRTHDTITAFSEGVLYPRWSPHAVYGYGAPILHFTPPLASYLSALTAMLFTDQITVSISLLLTATLALSSAATYTYLLQHLGARAALVGALAYLLSPAVMWLMPFQQGDIAAAFAAWLVPLFVWALDRMLRRSSAFDAPLLACVWALLMLADPKVHAVTALGLGGAAVCLRAREARRLWPQMLFSLLMGTAVSAFYWLPAWIEAEAVPWRQIVSEPRPILELSDVVLPFVPPDPIAGAPPAQPTVGFAVVALLTAAIGIQLLQRRWQRFSAVWLCAAGVIVFVSVRWQMLSLAPMAAWCSALVGASLITTFRAVRTQRYSCLIAIIITAAAFVPVYLAFERSPVDYSFSAQGQLQFELRGYGIAGVPAEDSIPSHFPLSAPPSASLLAAYTRGSPDRLMLLNGTPDKAVLLRAQSQSSTYTIASASPLNALYTVNPFMGWQASLNGTLVDLLPTPESTGYLFNLPPTRAGELRVYFGSTTARQVASLISAGGLTGLLFLWNQQRRHKDWQVTYPALLTSTDLRLLFVLVLTLLAAVTALLSGRFFPPPAPAPGTGLMHADLLQYASSSPLQLIAYQIDDPSDSIINVTLHWRLSRPTSDLLYLTGSLVSTTGEVLANSLTQPLSRIPTTGWRTDRYYTTHLRLNLNSAAEAERFMAALRVFPCSAHGLNCMTSRAITFFDTRGADLGAQLTLPRILTRLHNR